MDLKTREEELKKIKDKLLKAKPIMVIDSRVKSSLRAGESPPEGSYFIYPPMNTFVNFSGATPALKLSAGLEAELIKTLPENFSLKTIPGITQVPNQRTCGSCWAFATAGAVNDVFVVQEYNKRISQGEVDPIIENPDISPMYLLVNYPACREMKDCNYPQSYVCGGGNPYDACLWIKKYGISSNKCVNYDACDNSVLCRKGEDPQAHFKTDLTLTLNNLFPSAGCYVSSKNHVKYTITTANRNSVDVSANINYPASVNYKVNVNQHKSIVTAVKQHIMNYGTCIAGFTVLSNFILGPGNSFYGICASSEEKCSIFCKNPKGIYLDTVNYNYKASETQTFSDQTRIPMSVNSNVGGHAICITGWGVGKVHKSLIDPALNPTGSDCVDVPYWECRNSWGPGWNRDGYFKIAMWPFNTVSVMEINLMGLGGILSFKPLSKSVPQVLPIKQNDRKGLDTSKLSYFTPPSPAPKPVPPVNKELCDSYTKKLSEQNSSIDKLTSNLNLAKTELDKATTQVNKSKTELDKAKKDLSNLITERNKNCSILKVSEEGEEAVSTNVSNVKTFFLIMLIVIILSMTIYKFYKK